MKKNIVDAVKGLSRIVLIGLTAYFYYNKYNTLSILTAVGLIWLECRYINFYLTNATKSEKTWQERVEEAEIDE